MSSTTKSSSCAYASGYDWRSAGLRYYAHSFFLRSRFGHRVQKVGIDAGFTCPNVDGTLSDRGCTFCDNRSFSPSRRAPRMEIRDQIDEGIQRIRRRMKCDHFIAYFQPATNTYAPIERLRRIYEQALADSRIVAMAIGTRPDCVSDQVLDLLSDIAGRTHLSVEYGMQSMHDRSLEWMNCGRRHDAFVDAMHRSRGRGFEICAHVILGIPVENHGEMMATASELTRLGINSVKIHNLYAAKNTPLADQVQRGEVALIERDDYIRTLVDFLERLPPTVVVERISGDAPREFLFRPVWCLDKPGLRNALQAELERRDTWQGRRCPLSLA